MANPISRTAYYTLAVRAADAAQPTPILGDTFAQRFMNDDTKAVWEEFKSFTPANTGNTVRVVMIDEHLRRALAADPQATIVLIGAGFDTRAFRLHGGRRFEHDEAGITSGGPFDRPHLRDERRASRLPTNDQIARAVLIANQSLHDHGTKYRLRSIDGL